jgi:hypothetical protein
LEAAQPNLRFALSETWQTQCLGMGVWPHTIERTPNKKDPAHGGDQMRMWVGRATLALFRGAPRRESKGGPFLKDNRQPNRKSVRKPTVG